ncbi:hypothetical protein C2845_PM08G23800 [Panicum miliaceum]|uniref:Uncharacterized protein n=1 Tax=Panicum miliaceum TaxID=4540 RepID=A0A3L6R528_PANMI|nr:hypothetical protein C2845_PM08G23800 [Panicum miliaceum]
MATKLFLALQCVQCDTMQVKQEKKSSNKWVCVGLPRRRPPPLVQDANLARGRHEFAPLAEPEAGWDPAAVEEQGDEFPTEKKRTDWSEYLDDPGEHRDGCCGVGADASDGVYISTAVIIVHENRRSPSSKTVTSCPHLIARYCTITVFLKEVEPSSSIESGEGIEVITELPQNRPKVRPRKAQSGVLGKRPKPSTHPTLSKRQQIEQGSSPYCATTTADAQRSKWSKYLDVGFFEERKGSQSSGLHWSELDECATTDATSDAVVDDEVHPDFI